MVKEGSEVARKKKAARKPALDAIYQDAVVTKLINGIMLDGKKTIAEEIVYGAFDLVGEETGENPLDVFYKALNNIMPVLEVKARRIGGATYQVPMEVAANRRQTLALRWMINFSRQRGERTMIERLGREIIDASNETGASVRRKEEMHRMAEANKAFAHFRF